MKVSSKTRYAMKTVLDLAVHGDAGVVPASEIAKRQGIPRKFLEQILLVLKNGGLVESRRGVKGGYRLRGDLSAISLAAIIRLMGDSVLPSGNGRNASQPADPFDEVWQGISNHVKRTLEEVSVQDLCDRLETMSEARSPNYVI